MTNQDSPHEQREAELKQKIERLEVELKAVHWELTATQAILNSALHSFSWRCTRPFRKLAQIFAKGEGFQSMMLGPENVLPDQPAIFDAAWYLEKYPDIKKLGLHPWLHYVKHGAWEGRDPCSTFDTSWYLEKYADVSIAGFNPLLHYLMHGGYEGRFPNPYFDSKWYLDHYSDVAKHRVNPLVHFLISGAAELRNPNPEFHTAFYVRHHPEAAQDPLGHYLEFGVENKWPTMRNVAITEYLSIPSVPEPPAATRAPVDIIIPVYKGKAETLACLKTLISDPKRAYSRLIVVDDCSPDASLSFELKKLSETGAIELLSNEKNVGFVHSVNRGMKAATTGHDILLLNSDTEVPTGWLPRLSAQAHADKRIGTVTPFSNHATICSYPSLAGGPLPPGRTLADLDRACWRANAGRYVEIPTAVGFCMYIRRDCLDEVGLLDADAFGLGYGEENDFCLRASALGWTHRLACDVFIYHSGEVSFGPDSPGRQSALSILNQRYPDYSKMVGMHISENAASPSRFAISGALARNSSLPKILLISHALGGGTQRHVDELVHQAGPRAQFLFLQPHQRGARLSVPGVKGHPDVIFGAEAPEDIVKICRDWDVSRVHVHHLIGFTFSIRELISRLAVPFDFTVHDYYAICPQINLLPKSDRYCGEPDSSGCNACLVEKPHADVKDIDLWRQKNIWLLTEADRVICPSKDVSDRLRRYGMSARALVVPHEMIKEEHLPLRIPSAGSAKKTLTVLILGAMGPHKGEDVAHACAVLGPKYNVSFRLIGYTKLQPNHLLPQTGHYDDKDLQQLIAKEKAQVIWFPAVWPETYSYTLSAALASGLPIIAPRIGAFTERLQGRPWTWLIDLDSSTPEIWMKAFDQLRKDLPKKPIFESYSVEKKSAFYPDDYVMVETSEVRH